MSITKILSMAHKKNVWEKDKKMLTNAVILERLRKNVESETTRVTYEKKMKALLNLTHDKSEFGLWRILSKPQKYYRRLGKKYESDATKKNMVTAVLSVFKYADLVCSLKDAHGVWLEKHGALREAEVEKRDQNAASPQQADNYVSYEEIRAKFLELSGTRSGSSETPSSAGVKSAEEAHLVLKDSLVLCFLAFCVYQIPKRADLGRVRIYKKGVRGKDDENYITLDKVPGTGVRTGILVINKYKTAKTNEPIHESLKPEFIRVLRRSLKMHPREYLFVDARGQPFSSNDTYGQFVIRNMKRLFEGRSVGVNMLRHIYISENVDFNKMNDATLKDIAKKMGHSKSMQSSYRILHH